MRRVYIPRMVVGSVAREELSSTGRRLLGAIAQLQRRGRLEDIKERTPHTQRLQYHLAMLVRDGYLTVTNRHPQEYILTDAGTRALTERDTATHPSVGV